MVARPLFLVRNRPSMDLRSLVGFLVFISLSVCLFPVCNAIPSFIYPLSTDWNVTCNPMESKADYLQPILVSKNKAYAWGFLSSHSDASAYSCSLSVVCYSCQRYHTAWTATSKNSPTAEAILHLGAEGNLILHDSAGVHLWSTGSKNVKVIEMQESGNLVMFDNSKVIVWQSFDHPSNVLLPGQALQFGMSLVAGDYSAVMETGGLVLYVSTPERLPYLVLNASWGLASLDSVLEPTCARLKVVYSIDGKTLMMELDSAACYRNGSVSQNLLVINKTVTGKSNVNGNRYLKLDDRGRLRTYLNEEVDFAWFNEGDYRNGDGFCNLPNHCGPHAICDPGGQCRCAHPESTQSPDYISSLDYSVEDPESSGCLELQPVNCTESKSAYEVLRLEDLDYFPHRFLSPNKTSTLDDCVQSCKKNCSCTVAFYNNLTKICHHYQNALSMQRTTYGGNFLVFLKISTPAKANHNSERKLLGLGLSCAIILLVASLISVWGLRLRMNKLRRRSEYDEFLDSLPGLPPRFCVKQLEMMTSGFSVRLGAGGFGSVYEGIFPDGTRLAVKKLEGSGQGEKEFRAEVAALCGISHINLVRLRGFCAEGPHRMLVYDWMANGSLDRWLRSRDGEMKPLLNWGTRLRIAIDAARGLAFLHEESRERIFHLDIKPQNILLDESFVAKLSDFGLCKQVDRGQSRAITSARGTPGYVAPEWLMGLSVTDKSDVYSFGMVLLEIVSGRRNVVYTRSSEKWFFPAWVLSMARGGRWKEVMEEALEGCDGGDGVVKAMKVALWCVQEDPKRRPSMAAVLLMLEGHMEVADPPLDVNFVLASQARICASLADSTQGSGCLDAWTSALGPENLLQPNRSRLPQWKSF